MIWLQNQLFGSKSERIDPSQKELFEEGAEMGKPEAPSSLDDEVERVEPKSKRKRRRKVDLYPRNLPVVIKETLIPSEVAENPEAYEKITERYHDELDYTPARLQWERTVIAEYVSKEHKNVPPARNSAPLSAIEGAMITPALASALIVDKHCDHLPHYRQSQRFFREQTVELSHKTINQWVLKAAKHLAPIAREIGKELRNSEVLQIDETPMHYLQPGSGKAQTGYFWVMRNPQTGASFYQWQKGRSAQALLETLGHDKDTGQLEFKGTIQCDGYVCYTTVMTSYEGIKLAACLAHIRRKFVDDKSLRTHGWVAYIIKAIRVLYSIERHLKKAHAPPDQIKRQRRRRAKPIADRILEILKRELPLHRPQGNCGKAISYALNQWSQFELYLDDGRLAIDNNGVENAIRPCKLGLKNYLFFGSLEAGENNAVLYTLIENCKAEGVNPRSYLEYVIGALREQPATELTPSKLASVLNSHKQSA